MTPPPIISFARIEPGNRVQLPPDWLAHLGCQGVVALELTANGILIRPSPRFTWDDIFPSRLTIGSAPPDPNDDVELTGDDFLY